ncbi:hypothetical protein Pmani_009000 [Petrolisthes manimaculis]|uniref:Uncharacterized protein n=1 Tax=Petrolisthes manimaculis TaxID=1843537 RepID=A0AAE1Q7W7_9EUCA|nr:hypothetical protein Pmani_009000 [Petrolisthes manimaculis]
MDGCVVCDVTDTCSGLDTTHRDWTWLEPPPHSQQTEPSTEHDASVTPHPMDQARLVPWLLLAPPLSGSHAHQLPRPITRQFVPQLALTIG